MRYTTIETADLLGISLAKLRWHIYRCHDLKPEKQGTMLFFTDEMVAILRAKLDERAATLERNRLKREAQRRPRATRTRHETTRGQEVQPPEPVKM